MRIGVPKEIKTHEYRVGLTPASVRELVEHGHEVLVETDAGAAIRLVDAMYRNAGARIAAFRGDFVQSIHAPRAEQEPRSFARKCDCGGCSETARSARDQNPLVFKSRSHARDSSERGRRRPISNQRPK